MGSEVKVLRFTIGLGVAVLVLLGTAACEIPFRMPAAKTTLSGYQIESGYSGGLAVVKDRKAFRHGYIDAGGAVVIPARFSDARPFSEGLAAVEEDFRDGFGYIDRQGQWAIEPQFDSALPFSEEMAAVRLGNKWGFIDRSGTLQIRPRYDDAFGFSGGRARVVSEGLFGFVDRRGEWVVPPTFYKAGDFRQGRAFVCDRSLCGFIDESGRHVTPREFDDAGTFSEGLAPVRRGEKWGYLDLSGKVVIEPRFDEASEFSEGLAKVGIVKESSFDPKFGGYTGRSTFRGFIDRQGREVIGPKILDATSFVEGISVVRVPQGGLCSDCYQYRLMKRDGEFMPGRFDLASEFSGGRAVVTTADRSYVVDKKGSPIVELDHSYISDRTESWHRVTSLRFGYVDVAGAVVLSHVYASAQPFSEGLAMVEGPRERRVYPRRFIDRAGSPVVEVPQEVSRALPFTDGLSLVSNSDGKRARYGFMNRTGALVIPAQYADAAPFSEGLAAVKVSSDLSTNDWGYIDTKGAFVIPPRFKAAGSFSNGLAFVEWVSEERYIQSAVIDARGRHVVEKPFLPEVSRALFGTPSLAQFQARRSHRFGEPLVPTIDGGVHGYSDRSGKLVIRDARFIHMGLFSEGRAPVMVRDAGSVSGGSWGYIDPKGRLAISAMFTEARGFSEGLAWVRDGAGRFGAVTPSGELAIPPMWLLEVHPFCSGASRVKVNGRYGYLDQTGAFRIPPGFVRAEDFSDGLAVTGVANPARTRSRARAQSWPE